MSKRGREIRADVKAWLVEFGVSEPYEFGVTGSSHQEVRFIHAGHRHRFIFPGTPGDRRSALNCRSALRNVIRKAEATGVLMVENRIQARFVSLALRELVAEG